MLDAIKCPNCGEKPEVKDLGDNCYYAMCNCIACSKNKYSFLGITPKQAIRAWNENIEQGERYARKNDTKN